jgi:hypothetical protein
MRAQAEMTPASIPIVIQAKEVPIHQSIMINKLYFV